MYESPSSKLILKRIGITLGVIIGVVAIGWGVVSLLKAFTPQVSSPEPSVGRILKPAEVIEAFSQVGAVQALSADKYTLQLSQTSTTVIHKLASSSFAVATPTTLQVMYYSKTSQVGDDSEEVGKQTTAFMESAGYKKIENSGSAQSQNPRYTTYEAPLSLCQLTSSHPAPASNIPSYHRLVCIDKTEIQAEYEAVTPLLTLFKESGQASPNYNEVTRMSKTEGNKSFSILRLLGDDGSTSLLFAAVDNKWTYLGNLSGTEGSQTNGKYSISSELRRAMADPLYGDFLTKNIP